MRFKGLDLNLLVVLEELLVSRSVVRTADRLNLSSPAISAALRRLRDYFDDPLLTAHGKQFHLTVLAQSLLPLVTNCLGDVDSLISAARKFDPTTSQRTFRVVCSDYVAVVLMDRVTRSVTSQGPTINIELMMPDDTAARRLRDGSIDLVIGPEVFVTGDQPYDFLFEERHVFVGCRGNELLRDGVSESVLSSAPHAVTLLGPGRVLPYGDQQLAALGIQRRFEVSVGNFSAIPWLVSGSARLALMHERLARIFAGVIPLDLFSSPVELRSIRIVQQFNRIYEDDAGLAWFRKMSLREAESIRVG